MHLDPETDRVLRDLAQRRGVSISAILRAGIRELGRQLAFESPDRHAYEIYRELDLGPGGTARGPASESREVVRRVLLERHPS